MIPHSQGSGRRLLSTVTRRSTALVVTFAPLVLELPVPSYVAAVALTALGVLTVCAKDTRPSGSLHDSHDAEHRGRAADGA